MFASSLWACCHADVGLYFLHLGHHLSNLCPAAEQVHIINNLNFLKVASRIHWYILVATGPDHNIIMKFANSQLYSDAHTAQDVLPPPPPLASERRRLT